MFVFGNLFSGIAYVLNLLLDLYFWVIFARAILSWIRPDPSNPIVKTICMLVDPLTYRISKIIPTRIGMVDVAPFILMLAVIFIQKFLVSTLFDMGMRMK
ncbi:MAG: YggT family protein [Proteobacteria bacterium]|nr:YggT family protein [Pseudomonadota bacterium]